MKMKAKKTITNLPKTIFGVFTKFLAALLRYIGISSGKSILFKFMPIKTILQWLLNFLMLFFPALAPLIGISKLMIWIFLAYLVLTELAMEFYISYIGFSWLILMKICLSLSYKYPFLYLGIVARSEAKKKRHKNWKKQIIPKPMVKNSQFNVLAVYLFWR